MTNADEAEPLQPKPLFPVAPMVMASTARSPILGFQHPIRAIRATVCARFPRIATSLVESVSPN